MVLVLSSGCWLGGALVAACEVGAALEAGDRSVVLVVSEPPVLAPGVVKERLLGVLLLELAEVAGFGGVDGVAAKAHEAASCALLSWAGQHVPSDA
jgi:hypothetical protein